MKWNEHLNLKGKHAILSASSSHWLRYDDEKLISTYDNMLAKELGTELHELASQLIKKRITVSRKKVAFNMFVNDSIKDFMESEKTLVYSDVCFGTADAISFRDGYLRIYDLKTGRTKTSFDQLYIYAALFCLEYNVKPTSIELRIYQGNSVKIDNPDMVFIDEIISRVIHCSSILMTHISSN